MQRSIAVLIGLCFAVGLFGGPVLAEGGTDFLGGTPWFATGLMLKPGTMVTIRAEGRWTDCNTHTCSATPNGNGVQRFDGCVFIAPEISAGSLIARMGKKEPVFVGTGPMTITGYGKLKFAINDCYFGDNTGGFNVTVTYPTDAVVINTDAEVAG